MFSTCFEIMKGTDQIFCTFNYAPNFEKKLKGHIAKLNACPSVPACVAYIRLKNNLSYRFLNFMNGLLVKELLIYIF